MSGLEGCFVDSWNLGHYLYKGFRFENTQFFGPFLINKNGDIKARQPGGRSPFWDVFAEWYKLSDEEKSKTEVEDC